MTDCAIARNHDSCHL